MLKCKTCEAGVLKKFDGHFEDGPPTAVHVIKSVTHAMTPDRMSNKLCRATDGHTYRWQRMTLTTSVRM